MFLEYASFGPPSCGKQVTGSRYRIGAYDTAPSTRGRTLDKRGWPEWWEWELELSPHLLKRMEDRGFNEVDLRSMPARASNYGRDVVEGRWVVESRRKGRRWEVIVEPDGEQGLLVVVTAFPVWAGEVK